MSAPTFYIKSSNNDFQNKQKDIFSLLADAEKNVELAKNVVKQNDIEAKISKKHLKRKTKQYRGQDSLFKRPFDPPFKIRNIPDFQRNPERWTKYTLADVSPDDLSETSNKTAAFTFLNSLKKKESTDSDVKHEPIVFNKRLIKKPGFGDVCNPIEDKPPPERPHFKSSKLIMPEYEVGAKINKQKKERGVKVAPPATVTSLKLNHLMSVDDGDGDDE